jgi:hypothetical protein
LRPRSHLMLVFAAAAFAAAVLAPPAAAAPPANDNRSNAANLPDFPSQVQGTTAEATVERLDPQVSRCGRIESTVWYDIDAAPDGTIVISLQASSGLAPVVRIYRRNRSNIEELDCGRGSAGGKVVVSTRAVRGAGYLVAVGRRPGTADGEFSLRAELFLPPENDEFNDATDLGRLPAAVRGTTLGATPGRWDSTCGLAGGTVWYGLTGPASGRAVVRLTTAEELNAVVAVFARVRSNLRLVACARTDDDGRAALAFAARRGARYLVVVGEQPNSPPGAFQLQVQAAEAPERAPGRLLPASGVRDSVNAATDVNDIWSARLRRGTTYRIAFSSTPCATATLRARTRTFRLGCRAYLAFTPGRDGGGRYTIEIGAGEGGKPHRYRLRIVPAASDDVGVGIPLQANSVRRGRLSPNGVDIVDVYHFAVERLSETRLRLAQPRGRSYTLVLVSDTGGRIASGSSVRRRLGRGRYVVAVQGTVGDRPGRYRLALRLRDVTSTSVRVSAPEIAPGSAVTISCLVSPASGGRVELQIDRFDPLTGWHFHHVLRLPAGAAATWRPPTAGRWRARATFLGTPTAARSRSGYAHIVVARPIQ